MQGTARYAQPIADLVREQAARGTPFRFRVTTGSMAPLVQAGDELVIRAAAPETLHPGDLVLFDAGGLFVAHRLRAVLPDGRLLTQGDRNIAADRPWPGSALIGLAVAVARGDEVLDLTAGPGRACATWIGRVARVERGVYRAVRAVKRALFGNRHLGASAAVTRAVRGPFVAFERLLAKRRTS